jgi:hypothetical protein
MTATRSGRGVAGELQVEPHSDALHSAMERLIAAALHAPTEDPESIQAARTLQLGHRSRYGSKRP